MPENYILLERTELNASAASVTFANIPQTGYTDLKIETSLRDTSTGVVRIVNLTLNGSTANFTGRNIQGNGSATGSFSQARRVLLSASSSSTANTFSNGSIYFPNYTSSTNKSFSADSVGENNATESYQSLDAGLWSNTAAITSIEITPDSGSFVAGSTFSLYGIAALGTTPAIAPKASGGNIIDFDGTYWIHTFLTSGTFTPQVGLTCDYLVIAGGASGGKGGTTNTVPAGDKTGGGGAGGYISSLTASGGGGAALSPIAVTSGTSYTITVGAGGSNTSGVLGTGSNSTFSTVTASGGGQGGNSQAAATSFTNGQPGGSGGGGVGYSGTRSGGSGTTNQGFAGGSGSSDELTYRSHGGGGGAGAVGGNGNTSSPAVDGAGGAGLSNSITGSAVTRGVGGGGGSVGSGASGTVNTGNGGGGAFPSGGFGTPGAGGSGIVIIRYPAA
jgi:hypothetical protein